MRLRGAPPEGVSASYVNSPEGEIIGGLPGPKGDQGFSFAGLTPALDGTAVQGLVETKTGVAPVGDPIPVSVAWNSTVTHGSDPNVLRPPVSVAVIWIGDVEPANAIDGDVWMDTAGTAPTITTTVLNSLNKGMPIVQQLTATGTTPITWSVVAGALPDGLVLSSAGELSGRPTNEGQAYDFTVQAWSGYGSDTAQYTGTVGAALAPTILTTSLGGVPTAGTPYSQPLAASGSLPLTWSINAGTLPNGLSINSMTGTISGTPTVDGAYDFTVRATNSVGYDDQRFTGTIQGAAPVISTVSLNPINQGGVFSQIPAVTGSSPITWSINAGSLPSGLSLNAYTGEISGTPTVFGAYDFTVRATNAYGYDDQRYTGTIASAIPVITTTGFGSLYRAVAFSDAVVATGATPITWSVVSGSLPTGLSLNASTGAVTGTPSVVGAYDFTVRATNTYGTGDQRFTGAVLESTPSITETALNNIPVSQAFSQTLHATGYTPITWSVSAGTLPTGLSLNASTGVLSGTATATGAYDFTVRATNSIGYDEQQFTGSILNESGPPFDAVSDFFAGHVNNVAGKVTINAAAGADIILFYGNGGNVDPSNVKCNGVAMTLISGSQTSYAGNPGNGKVRAYRAAGAGTGSPIDVTFTTPPAAVDNGVVAVSYTGVTSVTDIHATSHAAGNPYTVGPLSRTTAKRRVVYISAGSNVNAIATTPSAGTVRFTAPLTNINTTVSDTSVDQSTFSTVLNNPNNGWAEIDFLVS